MLLWKKLMAKTQLNNNELIDKKAYIKHDRFKEIQNKHYKLKKEDLKDKKCIIVMDFKQNFVLGKGPIETNHDFYNKEHVSCLGFYIVYKKDNKLQREYYNYLSSILSHDSLYVANCVSMLIEKYLKNKFEVFDFWSDNACHFRCFELYDHILKEIPAKYQGVKCTMNFFNEYHGKSEIDGHFGEL